MEFRILGPLEVVEGSRSIPLGGAKQRALLAVLVLNANRVTSTDRLIDALWGETAPEGAAHTVQVYVSQLRKALRTENAVPPEEFLVTQGRGYVLRVGDGEVDLQRFEATIEEGRRALADGAPERASLLLRDALHLWRGPPLAGLEFETFAPLYIARIEDLRLSAIEDRIEADLALGRQGELVGELQALVSEFPLRERLRGQLMLALYRSGRQAEALQAYRNAKQMLAEELGIDPTPDLQRLERAILQQDPELDRAETAETAKPIEAPGERMASRRDRRPRTLVGIGAALLAVVVIASVAILVGGRSGAPPPSEVAANSVGRIDSETGMIVAAIPTTGTAPSAVVWADGSLWVANTVSRTVARIDPETNRVIQTVPSGGAPTDLAAGGGMIWVLDGLDGRVLAIDPRTDEVTGTTDVPVGAGGIAFGAGAVWVTDTLAASVTKIDPETREVVGKIRLGEPGSMSPKAIAVDDNHLWVGDGLKPVLLQIDVEAGQVAATVGLRAVPTEIAVGGDAVWVTSYEADLVTVIDQTTLQTTTIQVGQGPTGVAFGDGAVWVAEGLDRTVSKVDPSSKKVVRTIRVGGTTDDVVIGDGSVWVSVHA